MSRRDTFISAFLLVTDKCESFNSPSAAKYTGNIVRNLRVKEELKLYV